MHCATVPNVEREALELAAERIRAYHVRQMPQDAQWTDPDGATLGWRWTPVQAAGLYVPGGLASYPSSVLMNAVPAKVAGRRAARDGGADAGRRRQSAGAAGRPDRRRRRDLPDRRRAGDRRARLRHRDDRAGRQDHRPGQRLCRGRQAPGLRQGRDRHDRRAVRDPGDRRRRQRPRLDRRST